MLTEQNQNLIQLPAERLPPLNGNPQIVHPQPLNPLVPPPPVHVPLPLIQNLSEADDQLSRVGAPIPPGAPKNPGHIQPFGELKG